MRYPPISERDEQLASSVVDTAYTVHKALGPGLLESVYETCFCYELTKRNIKNRRQVVLPIRYDNLLLDDGLRLDVLVENRIICELKAVDRLLPVHTAQLISYLKLADKRLGFIINFNVPLIKSGIKRVVH